MSVSEDKRLGWELTIARGGFGRGDLSPISDFTLEQRMGNEAIAHLE